MEKLPVRAVESREREESPEGFVEEFLDMTPGELTQLKERIRAVQGHVRIAVHPLYIGRHKGSFFADETAYTAEEVDASLAEGFTKTVTSTAKNEKSSPLLVFEEEQYVDETKATLKEQLGVEEHELVRNGIVLVKTERGSGNLSGSAASAVYEQMHSVPPDQTYEALTAKQRQLIDEVDRINGERKSIDELLRTPMTEEEAQALLSRSQQTTALFDEHRKIEEILDERRMTVFKTVCDVLGIRSALISGGYFYNFERANADELKRLQGCAGSVTELLRDEGIAVDISRFAWTSRDRLKDQGIETKQTGKRNVSDEDREAA